jgi:hypothetical protein
MPKMRTATTPSKAKCAIKRALGEVIDPSPSEKEVAELWVYFCSSCIFCGCALARDSRKGHIDHLVAKSAGGSNHIANRVLSCDGCNGDDKREAPWEQFLEQKCAGDQALVAKRSAMIEEWVALKGPPPVLSRAMQTLLDDAVHGVTAVFDEQCSVLRAKYKPATSKTPLAPWSFNAPPPAFPGR